MPANRPQCGRNMDSAGMHNDINEHELSWWDRFSSWLNPYKKITSINLNFEGESTNNGNTSMLKSGYADHEDCNSRYSKMPFMNDHPAERVLENQPPCQRSQFDNTLTENQRRFKTPPENSTFDTNFDWNGCRSNWTPGFSGICGNARSNFSNSHISDYRSCNSSRSDIVESKHEYSLHRNSNVEKAGMHSNNGKQESTWWDRFTSWFKIDNGLTPDNLHFEEEDRYTRINRRLKANSSVVGECTSRYIDMTRKNVDQVAKAPGNQHPCHTSQFHNILTEDQRRFQSRPDYCTIGANLNINSDIGKGLGTSDLSGRSVETQGDPINTIVLLPIESRHPSRSAVMDSVHRGRYNRAGNLNSAEAKSNSDKQGSTWWDLFTSWFKSDNKYTMDNLYLEEENRGVGINSMLKSEYADHEDCNSRYSKMPFMNDHPAERVLENQHPCQRSQFDNTLTENQRRFKTPPENSTSDTNFDWTGCRSNWTPGFSGICGNARSNFSNSHISDYRSCHSSRSIITESLHQNRQCVPKENRRRLQLGSEYSTTSTIFDMTKNRSNSKSDFTDCSLRSNASTVNTHISDYQSSQSSRCDVMAPMHGLGQNTRHPQIEPGHPTIGINFDLDSSTVGRSRGTSTFINEQVRSGRDTQRSFSRLPLFNCELISDTRQAQTPFRRSPTLMSSQTSQFDHSRTENEKSWSHYGCSSASNRDIATDFTTASTMMEQSRQKVSTASREQFQRKIPSIFGRSSCFRTSTPMRADQGSRQFSNTVCTNHNQRLADNNMLGSKLFGQTEVAQFEQLSVDAVPRQLYDFKRETESQLGSNTPEGATSSGQFSMDTFEFKLHEFIRSVTRSLYRQES